MLSVGSGCGPSSTLDEEPYCIELHRLYSNLRIRLKTELSPRQVDSLETHIYNITLGMTGLVYRRLSI